MKGVAVHVRDCFGRAGCDWWGGGGRRRNVKGDGDQDRTGK